MTEEWEQCEKKLKDVRAWLDKARQTLDSPLNKKRPLRDQLSLREKMVRLEFDENSVLVNFT